MKEIAVTGFSGFVGKNLLKYLNGKVGVIKLDIRDEGNISDFGKAETVVHLAGKAHDLRKTVDPNEYYAVNFELTKRLYQQFITSNASKFIFISSVKASADQVQGNLTETDEARPQTHYGKSKLMAEKYIQDQDLPNGKSFYILRPCMIHGPGNKGNLNLLYKIIASGLPYPLAAFENRRSFLSVDNLSFVIKEFIERRDIPSGIYNLADDEPLSTNEVITLISEGIARRSKLWKINPAIIKKLAKIGDRLHLPLTSERLDKLTESYVVSNAKLVAALGKTLPIDARKGILNTIKSFASIK